VSSLGAGKHTHPRLSAPAPAPFSHQNPVLLLCPAPTTAPDQACTSLARTQPPSPTTAKTTPVVVHCHTSTIPSCSPDTPTHIATQAPTSGPSPKPAFAPAPTSLCTVAHTPGDSPRLLQPTSPGTHPHSWPGSRPPSYPSYAMQKPGRYALCPSSCG
jgi:hypothetical protein